MNQFVTSDGIPFHETDRLPDGQVLVTAGAVYLGTGPLSYVDATIRRITLDVFGKDFLQSIGAYKMTADDVRQVLEGTK